MFDKINYCLAETHKHVKRVNYFLNLFVIDILKRGQTHDNSKFEEPELSVYAEHTPKLKDVVYGSEEYKSLLKLTKPAIEHHYKENRHHPEYWPNGIDDMTLVDLIELLSDWRAATERNKNGNIRRSLDLNTEKYKISPQLKKILENTIGEYLEDDRKV